MATNPLPLISVPGRSGAGTNGRPIPVARPAEAVEETIDLSVVLPLLNERGNIEPLYSKLADVLDGLDRSSEIIFVDDGSTDGSFNVLRDLQARDNRVRVVRFRRNFGQTAAFAAGFDLARGNVIVTMDCDMQNDPADIPRLLEKVEEGYDVVSGWRIHRQDALLSRRLPSQGANFLISRLTGVHLHDYGCSLKAYRSEVVKNIRLYGEMHRFIPALASWMGTQVAEIPVNHYPRRWGKSKYGLSRTLRVVLDLITVKFLLGYATRPIQIFGLIGMLCLLAGTAIGGYLSVLKFVFDESLADRPLLLLAILLVVLGVQLITMGLIGELVVRVYYEAQGKTTYVTREVLDGTGSEAIPPALNKEDIRAPAGVQILEPAGRPPRQAPLKGTAAGLND
jgi:glycosyltransferase involved in cell wall biosynthesis